MVDPYRPFMGKKGRSWGELDLPGIAGRVAGMEPATPPEVEVAVKALVAVCKKAGMGLDAAKMALEEGFAASPVSAVPLARTSGHTRRR